MTISTRARGSAGTEALVSTENKRIKISQMNIGPSRRNTRIVQNNVDNDSDESVDEADSSGLIHAGASTSRSSRPSHTVTKAHESVAASPSVILMQKSSREIPQKILNALNEDACNVIRVGLFDGKGVLEEIIRGGIDRLIIRAEADPNFEDVLNDKTTAPLDIFIRCWIVRVIKEIRKIKGFLNEFVENPNSPQICKSIINSLDVILKFLLGNAIDISEKNTERFVNLLYQWKYLKLAYEIGAGRLVNGEIRAITRKEGSELVDTILSITNFEKDGLDDDILESYEEKISEAIKKIKDDILKEKEPIQLGDDHMDQFFSELCTFLGDVYSDSFKQHRKNKASATPRTRRTFGSSTPLSRVSDLLTTNDGHSNPQMIIQHRGSETASRKLTKTTARYAIDGDRRMAPGAIDKRREPSHRRKWTQEETDALEMGMREYGVNWVAILRNHPILSSRTNVNLKDRARSMKIQCARRGEPLGVWALATGEIPPSDS